MKKNYKKKNQQKKMKFLQIVQTRLFNSGVGPTQRPFNKIQLKIIFEALSPMILLCVYLIRVANTPKEYMNAIFMISAAICLFTGFISVIFQTANLSHYIDHFEKTIEKRTFKVQFKNIFRFLLIYSSDSYI